MVYLGLTEKILVSLKES